MKGFRQFLLRGNVVDLAIGIVIGAAFGALVTAFVQSFITPLVGLATGKAGDFSKNGFTVSVGGSQVLFPYGVFITALIAFALIAAAVYFFVVIPVNRLMERYQAEAAPTKSCPECLSKIPEAALRCSFCGQPQVSVVEQKTPVKS